MQQYADDVKLKDKHSVTVCEGLGWGWGRMADTHEWPAAH
jgi:hypothetical protein